MIPQQPQTVKVLFARENPSTDIPEVTVVIPLYNYGHFLVETLDSVLGQTLAGLDLIVVDDASTDDGARTAENWLDRNAARFRKSLLLRHDRNMGLATTRNTGFRRAETGFVFPLDADNLLYSTCLEKLVKSLRNSRAAFAYCLVERFAVPASRLPPPHLMHLHLWKPELLGKGNTIDAMVLMRKQIWELVGGYNASMPSFGWEDYDLWFRIARLGAYGLQVPQILARYRVHDASMLQRVTNQKKSQQALNHYLRQQYPEFFLGP